MITKRIHTWPNSDSPLPSGADSEYLVSIHLHVAPSYGRMCHGRRRPRPGWIRPILINILCQATPGSFESSQRSRASSVTLRMFNLLSMQRVPEQSRRPPADTDYSGAVELRSFRQQRFHLGDDVGRLAGDFLRELFELVGSRRVK